MPKFVKNPAQLGKFLKNRHNEQIQVSWSRPEIGWTKLNFDGSCKGIEKNGSIGGVFRNHRADFLLGYAESIGKTTSILAEVAALRRGLELVLENGFSNVWLEGDSKALVDIISQRRNAKCIEVQKEVGLINLIIPEINNCTVSHIYREGNRAADLFARIGHGLDNPKIWKLVPPDEVVDIMQEDAEGRICLRKK